ncbi:methyltransferase family protein [Salinimicrobium gaetbulicola]|uniref:Methyltransferase family protein n=1 Tax=Salinimicrobium gaetbulicola TaxID=999702 RepID=A0ABW3IEG2_9FLAO
MPVPLKDKIYVLLQIVIFLAWLFDAENLFLEFPENLRWIALFVAGIGGILIVIAFIQLNTRLSPFPSPKKGSRLITSGAFTFARHPIYSGILMIAFGLSFWLGSGYKLIISLVLAGLFYAKSSYEEKRLQERFPEYGSYKAQTGRFFPKFNWRI